MIIICYFLSLAVSASILIWLIKLKKKDPFPKNSILWMLLWGVWGCAVSAVFCAGLEIAMMIRKLGFDTVYAVFMESTGDNFEDNIDALMAVRGGPSFLSLFWEGFITAAIPEEIVKFFITREFIINKKLAAKDTIFNSIMCCSFVALGFQMVEDFMYVNGGILSAIFRAMTPLHFTFDVIMGYFIGKALLTGDRKNMAFALLIPTLIHGIYDLVIEAISLSNWLVLLFTVIFILCIVLTVIEIKNINKLSKEMSLHNINPGEVKAI